MSSNLHPIVAKALQPWMPMHTLAELAELDEQRQRLIDLREKLFDE